MIFSTEMFSGTTIDSIYPELIKQVINSRDSSSPRGMKIREIYNANFRIEDATKGIVVNAKRKVNFAYAVIEMLGLLQHGISNVEPYTWYNSVMKNYLNPDTQTWDGSYATRIHMYNQMGKIYKILKQDPDSRRAVIGIYNPRHDFHDYESKDICCTLNLIFRLRNGKLNLTCTMRSNDVWLGVPYDLTQFTFLQSVMSAWLEVEMGEYHHFAANLHAYERDIPKMQELLEDWYEKGGTSYTAWDTMGKWDIPMERTKHEILMFFSFDREFRNEVKDHSDENFELLYDRHCKSQFIKKLYKDICLPYIRNKLSKK